MCRPGGWGDQPGGARRQEGRAQRVLPGGRAPDGCAVACAA